MKLGEKVFYLVTPIVIGFFIIDILGIDIIIENIKWVMLVMFPASPFIGIGLVELWERYIGKSNGGDH